MGANPSAKTWQFGHAQQLNTQTDLILQRTRLIFMLNVTFDFI
jgi:hypothetical protein